MRHYAFRHVAWACLTLITILLFCDRTQAADGDRTIDVNGQLQQWHKVTLSLRGPMASESDRQPNPFTDYRFAVQFRHESGATTIVVPGYFAADGNAANSSATAGNVWRAHFAPPRTGSWTYSTLFHTGDEVAVTAGAGEAVAAYHGLSGTIQIDPTDKSGRDLRAKGCLNYVGKRYLQFAGSGEYFLKVGPDAPETLLAYKDFDNTVARNANKAPLKTWQPHVQDWKAGDPTWKNGKGKGLIGAINYLADAGTNTFSFLPYNAGGDGDNVWPFTNRNDKLHYDCSKLDQWGIVFDHATQMGMHLHFKMQENEMDDNRVGHDRNRGLVEEALDGGKLGVERKLYIRELVARFGHALALNWNMGEENTQSTAELKAMSSYIRDVDPYDHPIVVHTFPNRQDEVYTPLLGKDSALTGASLQNPWNVAHQRTLQWIRASEAAGKKWVVANDEQNPASMGVPPDIGYQGHDGIATQGDRKYTMHDIRKATLWGTLMAGGGGVEYYFGYQLPENDLVCEDFRSRDKSWKYGRIALNFFHQHEVPFWQMDCHDDLLDSQDGSSDAYCLAKPNSLYLVYLPAGDPIRLDLRDAAGSYELKWFNPRTGGALQSGEVQQVAAGDWVSVGNPPNTATDDWLAVLRKQ